MTTSENLNTQTNQYYSNRASKLKDVTQYIKKLSESSLSTNLISILLPQEEIAVNISKNSLSNLRDQLANHPHNAFINLMLAFSYLQHSRTDLAIAHFLRHARLIGINPLHIADFSIALFDNNLLDDFISIYLDPNATKNINDQRATGLSKKLYDFGLKLHNSNNYLEAVYVLDESKLLTPYNPWLSHLIGTSYFKMGKASEAIAPLETAISLNVSPMQHIFRLAEVYESTGEKSKAQQRYFEAYEISSDLKHLVNGLKLQSPSELRSSNSQVMKLAKHPLDSVIDTIIDHPTIIDGIIFHQSSGSFFRNNSTFVNILNILPEIDSTNDTLVLIFASRNEDHGNIRFQFKPQLSSFNIKKIFIRDVQDAWYSKGLPHLTTSIDTTAEYLKGMLKKIQYSRLVCMGSSSGGYAALSFGYLLNANSIYAFSPQTLLPRPYPFPDEKLLADCDRKYFDLTKLDWTKAKTKAHIFYSKQHRSDSEAANRMAQYPCFQLNAYDAGNNHNIAGWLKSNGLLSKIIKEMITGAGK